ncbi:unnamed protein product, partial [Polarella glacialis]
VPQAPPALVPSSSLLGSSWSGSGGSSSSTSPVASNWRSWGHQPSSASALPGMAATAAVLVLQLGRRQRRLVARRALRLQRAPSKASAESSAGRFVGFTSVFAVTPALLARAEAQEAKAASEADKEPASVFYVGVTDASILPYVQERLGASPLHEVSFVGILLTPDMKARGCSQLSACLRYLPGGDEEQVDFIAAAAKDVPLELPPGLVVAAVLPREDIHEALVLRTSSATVSSLSDLPPGSRVCAASHRRRLQIAG